MLKSVFSEVYPVLLVILFFCGSIIVHEFGHYIAAKARGLYVPRFSIGFGPRLFSKKFGETEFCISLLPLGGYVALPQLADLNKIEGQFELPEGAKQVTCADKIIVAVMGAVANIIFAIVLSFIVWHIGLPVDNSTLSRTIGYIENELILPDGKTLQSPASIAGLEIGDEILSVDGISVKNFSDIQQFLALGTNVDSKGNARSLVKFLRNGEERETFVYPVLFGEKDSVDKFRKIGILPKQELIVDSVLQNTDVSSKNIQLGDKLLSIDGTNILNIRFLQEYVVDKSSVQVRFSRKNKTFIEDISTTKLATIKPYLNVRLKDFKMDIIPYYPNNVNRSQIAEHTDARLLLFSEDQNIFKKYDLDNELELTMINGSVCKNLYDVFTHLDKEANNICTILRSDMPVNITIPAINSVELIPAVYMNALGINFRNDVVIIHKSPPELIKDTVSTTFKTLKGLFSRHSDISVKNLMGPTGLVRTLHMFSKTDIRLLLWFVILINVNLAILNMLPLPVLDGGCVVLALLEQITPNGCKCIDRIFGIFQSLFLVFLLGLLIYVSFFDVKRWIADTRIHNDYVRQIRLRI